MAELWFYHLERSELETTLTPLLEKCLQRGWRAIVRGGSPERLEALDVSLWTYRDESFLPHGREGEGDASRQPVLLTTAAGNPNQAQALFVIDGAEPGDVSAFERACLIFDGRDAHALEMARSHWKRAKDSGVAASYWRESSAGKWEKQA